MNHCHSEESFGKRHHIPVKFLQDGPTHLIQSQLNLQQEVCSSTTRRALFLVNISLSSFLFKATSLMTIKLTLESGQRQDIRFRNLCLEIYGSTLLMQSSEKPRDENKQTQRLGASMQLPRPTNRADLSPDSPMDNKSSIPDCWTEKTFRRKQWSGLKKATAFEPRTRRPAQTEEGSQKIISVTVTIWAMDERTNEPQLDK